VWEALVQSRVFCEGSEGWGGFKSQVRLNRVAEKVPEKVWEALLQSQVRFNRVPRRRFQEALVQSQVGFNGFRRRFRRRFREALVQSQAKFNRVTEKVPEKVPASLGAKPSQVQ